jgi:hypothetical protein
MMIPYLKLMRFHFHASFVTVIAGAWLFLPPGKAFPVLELLECYLCFNVLLYGGIYTFNDIIDIEKDAADEVKKKRPLPSGQITRKAALVFCIALVSSAFLVSWVLFRKEILFLFAAFVAANLLYTLIFKKVPYVGLSLVALTHTLRMTFGILIAGAAPEVAFIAAFYVMLLCIAVTIHSRYNAKPREVKYYPPEIVHGLQLVFLGIFSFLAAKGGKGAFLPFAWIVLAVVLLVFLMAAHFAKMRHVLARIFMIKTLPAKWPCASWPAHPLSSALLRQVRRRE